jgi:hypothetical protein
MVRVIQNNWSHTVGILISIQKGQCFEDRKTAGFTHIAEHFFFSGTEKHSRFNLREIQDRIFNQLEATTGYEEVRIFCYVDASNVTEALHALYEMIFRWKCRSDVFRDEKNDLVQEARAYYKSYEYRIRRETSTLLFSKPQEILGPRSLIEKLNYGDVPKIKSYWGRLLDNTSIDVCLLGAVGAKEKRLAKRLFSTDVPARQRKITWIMNGAIWLESPKGIGILIKHNTRHPFLLFLGQLFMQRCEERMNEHVSFESVQFQDRTLFCAVSDKTFDKKKARVLIEKSLTKKEFESAKSLFLKRFRHALDGIDPIDAMHWFHGFRRQAYRSLASEDPKAVYQLYQRMTFAQTKHFFKNVLREAK